MAFSSLNIQFDDFVVYSDDTFVFEFFQFAHHRAPVGADVFRQRRKVHFEFRPVSAGFSANQSEIAEKFIAYGTIADNLGSFAYRRGLLPHHVYGVYKQFMTEFALTVATPYKVVEPESYRSAFGFGDDRNIVVRPLAVRYTVAEDTAFDKPFKQNFIAVYVVFYDARHSVAKYNQLIFVAFVTVYQIAPRNFLFAGIDIFKKLFVLFVGQTVEKNAFRAFHDSLSLRLLRVWTLSEHYPNL
jgi:hypothetical protein